MPFSHWLTPIPLFLRYKLATPPGWLGGSVEQPNNTLLIFHYVNRIHIQYPFPIVKLCICNTTRPYTISIKVALGFGHWNTEYNAMLCLSDHQTMAFNDQSTIPKTTFIEVGEYFSPFRTSSISNEASFTYSPKWSYVSFTTPGHIQNQIQLNHCLSVPIVNLCSSNTTGPYTSQLSALYPRNFKK